MNLRAGSHYLFLTLVLVGVCLACAIAWPNFDRASAQNPAKFNGKIAFVTSRNGPPGEIYVMNPDGSDVMRLTNNPAEDYSSTWSPDGKQIVFESNRDGNGAEIYEMNADGSHQTRITHNPGDDNWATWIPAAGTP